MEIVVGLAALAGVVALLSWAGRETHDRIPPPPTEPVIDLRLSAPADMADEEGDRVAGVVATLISKRSRSYGMGFSGSLVAYRAAKDVLAIIVTSDTPLRDLELLEHAEEEMRRAPL